MISPINDNHQYIEIIKSSKAKPKIVKLSVLIPKEFNHDLNILASPNKLSNTFLADKEKEDVINFLSTKKNSEVLTTPIVEETITKSSLGQTISMESKSILEVQNYTNSSFSTSTLISSKNNKNSTTNLINNHNIENSFNVTFIPLGSTINENNKISNTTSSLLIKSNSKDNYEIMLPNKSNTFNTTVLTYNQYKTTSLTPIIAEKSENIEHNFNSSLSNLQNVNKMHNIKNYTYSISSNSSHLFKTVENVTLYENLGIRKRRSFELFFNSTVQVS